MEHLFPPPALSRFSILPGNRRVKAGGRGGGFDGKVVGEGGMGGGGGGCVGGGTLLPLGLPAGARWPSLSFGDLWEGHYEVWVAVTLTACDSTAPGTAVPASPSQRTQGPRRRGGRGGGGRVRPLWRRRGLGYGVCGGPGRAGVVGETRWGCSRAFALTDVTTSPLILLREGRPPGSSMSEPAQPGFKLQDDTEIWW